MTNLIEIRDLVVTRDCHCVLALVHLDIVKGKVVAVVGPNGAGKSTLLLVLARLLKPERGTIYYDSKRVESLGVLDYRRRIGLVFQQPLLLNMSVFDNIAIGLKFRGLPNSEITRRTGEWLERLRIGPLRDRSATRLSGGEAQRVALARVFVLQPELLLLDEPFSSLDKKTRHELLNDMKTLLPATGATTLFTTHDEREVQELAEDRIELDFGV